MPLAIGGAAALLLVLVIIVVVAWPSDEPELASSTPSAETPKDRDGEPPKPEPEDAPPDEPPPAVAGNPVLDALRSRRVRALDVLLVAAEASAASDHAKAASYCEGLVLEGLDGFRLPQVNELSAMGEANMLTRDTYWSSTPADLFGDSFLAWNGRRGYAAPHSDEAVALCVRSVSGGDGS